MHFIMSNVELQSVSRGQFCLSEHTLLQKSSLRFTVENSKESL